MTEQTDKPLTHLSLSASNRSAREYVNLAAEGLLWLDAPYQRGSVWTEAQQRGLVKSWKLGIPIPAVIVNDRNNPRWAERNGYDARYVVIDGKQRITAAIAMLTGGWGGLLWFIGAYRVASTIRRRRQRMSLPPVQHDRDKLGSTADSLRSAQS